MLFTERHALFVPLADGPDWGHFGLCPLLQQLLLIRRDIAQAYDIETQAGLADAIAWMYVRAVPEYGLDDVVDAETLSALNAPVSYYPLEKEVRLLYLANDLTYAEFARHHPLVSTLFPDPGGEFPTGKARTMCENFGDLREFQDKWLLGRISADLPGRQRRSLASSSNTNAGANVKQCLTLGDIGLVLER